jgi:hypothetical protein
MDEREISIEVCLMVGSGGTQRYSPEAATNKLLNKVEYLSIFPQMYGTRINAVLVVVRMH